MLNHTQNAPAPTVHLTFEGTDLTIIDYDGQPWLSSTNLARALGYSSSRSVSQIYDRNKDEFSDEMTVVLKLSTTGNIPSDTRVFSPRGCHLLAMFARTEKAKHFRKWVLDVLDKMHMDQPTNRAPYQLREQLAAAIRSVTVGFQGKGASYAINERIRNHFGVRRVEDLTTNQARDAIHMVEQLREPTLKWVRAMRKLEKDYVQQVLRDDKVFLSAPTLVCLDLEPQGIVAPLDHPELRRLQKANRGQRDMYSLFLDEGE